jgi:hypothetical protein
VGHFDQELGEFPAFISLGAGVQSTTMLLMAEHGELPKPEAAIFADTQWEPDAVYDHLEWLERTVETIPIVRVTAGDLREDLMRASRGEASEGRGENAGAYASPPLHWTWNGGPKGIGRRQCTREFKLKPITDELKRRGYGPRPADPCEQWLGISLDEIQRMKPSRLKWQHTRFPLIARGMTRGSCYAWLEEHGYPRPPKSACIGCPLHATAQWRDLKRNSPAEFADAVEVDLAIRHMPGSDGGEAYLHYSRRPLEDIDLSTPEDHGQQSLLEQAECEGGCFL